MATTWDFWRRWIVRFWQQRLVRSSDDGGGYWPLLVQVKSNDDDDGSYSETVAVAIQGQWQRWCLARVLFLGD